MLVVDDDALIRDMLVMAFENAGVPVLEAPNADEAVGILEAGGPVRAVVTDVRMPGRLDGLGLTAWLAQHRPEAPIVVLSGYASAEEVRAAHAAVAAVIAKPYRPDDIVDLVLGLGLGPAQQT